MAVDKVLFDLLYKKKEVFLAYQAVGYKENTKVLTRAQVRTIVQFLGEP